MTKQFLPKSRWLVTIILLLSLSIGQMWGTPTTIYTNAGATGTVSGVTASGNINNTASNGNPAPCFGNTTGANTTFTFAGFDLSDYTDLELSVDAAFKNFPSTVTTFPAVTVTFFKNDVAVKTDNTTISWSSKTTTYSTYTFSDLPDFDKITIVGGACSGKTGKGAAATNYGTYVDNITLTGTEAAPACADPSAPGNSSVSGTGVTISTSSAAANYDIYYSTSSTIPTTEDPTATITSGNSKAITGLSYGTTYYYWMRQNCGSSTSSWVAGSPTSFTTTVPAPTGVSAGSITMTGATISITDANNVNNYDVYCSESSTAPVAGTTPSASGTSKSIAVTGLTTGRTYYYWARAKGPNAKSTWYGGSTFTTVSLSSISVLTAPTTTKYLVGDNFDPTGLVITRTYSNSTSDTYSYSGHTAEFSFSPATNAALTAENTSVTITYGGQTTSQAINVYTVTVNKVNMSGTAIADANVSASCSGRTLSQSVGATDYVFDSYVVTAGGVTISTNTITSTPTGNVTINAKFHDPITVTWKVNDAPYTTGDPTGSVKYGTAWSSLKLPTDPTPPCEDVFVGWTTDDIGTTGLDKDDDDDATRIAALNLMTSANKSEKSTTITNNVTFYAVFADYTTD